MISIIIHIVEVYTDVKNGRMKNKQTILNSRKRCQTVINFYSTLNIIKINRRNLYNESGLDDDKMITKKGQDEIYELSNSINKICH